MSCGTRNPASRTEVKLQKRHQLPGRHQPGDDALATLPEDEITPATIMTCRWARASSAGAGWPTSLRLVLREGGVPPIAVARARTGAGRARRPAAPGGRRLHGQRPLGLLRFALDPATCRQAPAPSRGTGISASRVRFGVEHQHRYDDGDREQDRVPDFGRRLADAHAHVSTSPSILAMRSPTGVW